MNSFNISKGYRYTLKELIYSIYRYATANLEANYQKPTKISTKCESVSHEISNARLSELLKITTGNHRRQSVPEPPNILEM